MFLLLYDGFCFFFFFFFQAEDGIRDLTVTGVQTCALPIYLKVTSPPPACGFVTLRWPANTAPTSRCLPSSWAAAMPNSCSPTRFTSESAEPSSSTSVPGWAARISSENRSVANWCSEPLAFSTLNVTRPSRPYGLRSSRAGTGTGDGREAPPQAAEQSVRSATVRYTGAVTGRLRT